jgi:hypothetical protein
MRKETAADNGGLVADQVTEKAADCHHLQCILREESRWLEGHCCLLL